MRRRRLVVAEWATFRRRWDRVGTLDARIAEQSRRVAGIEAQAQELGDAIGG
jgi:hypothetical protein